MKNTQGESEVSTHTPKGVCVEMLGITKRFGSVVANDGVDVMIRPGRAHGLLGENGAGKSTLMSILYGLQTPDEGEIRIGGVPVTIGSPREAISLGIGLVHQELMLVPNLTVVENIVAGDANASGWTLNLRSARKQIASVAQDLGLTLDRPNSPASSLSVGESQRIEIIKAAYRGAQMLILDEPTSRLTPQEVEGLARIIEAVKARGGSVVLVTHKLKEVLDMCDDVTILRQGKKVAALEVSELKQEPDPASTLASMMVGRPVVLEMERSSSSPGDVALQLADVHVAADRDGIGLEGVNLELRQGEIIGIAGVAGNGQQQLAEAVLGLRKLTSGSILLHGQDVTRMTARGRCDLGLGCVPDDRKRAGIVPEMSVAENISLRAMRGSEFKSWGAVKPQHIVDFGREQTQDYDVRCGSVLMPIAQLSGGNQQKAILARELVMAPSVLLVLQPTAGLDVGAIEQVYERLIRTRDAGVAILLVSNELSEILSLSDRVGVLFAGGLSELEPIDQVDLTKLGRQMAGL